ncbi:hypothetical protein GCM10007981_00750 [Thermocladium modestius]|uniref:Polysaccharide biosynthesis protein n=1 Tax=Thermocladium modestius TaxID=62609 RepID=A0A830GTQ2_9CREN|nr:oligosaccharide flippase family protein [Thermocladium modestius]GGP18968.1 hypothetical protein GCM10007981_00750 [Thermocladium modestius]
MRPTAKPREESRVMGIILNYAQTLVNYGLAVAYVIVLTRYVPIEQYGYYNAIVSFVAIISLFFPTLGVDNAIAREAAGTHARGGDVIPYYSALASLTMFLSIMYAVALIFLAPILRYHGVPSYLVPIVYLLAAGIIINVLVGPMGFYLWSTQRTATQGLGSTIGSLTYRLAQIALILAMRNVYAIAIASLLGNLATLIFFLVHVRVAPRVIEGFRLLRGRLRSFFNSGFQYWIASYLGSLSGNILSYLVFLFLGPTPSALFGISVVMTGAVGGFSAAVGNVFGSSASHAWGMGLDVGEMAKRYALSAVAAASLLSSLAVLLAPLLVPLGVLVGNYVAALPYAMLFMGTASLSSLDSVYMTYYWVEGRGWLAVERTAVGAVITIAIYVAAAGRLGLYAAVLSSYVGMAVTSILYWINNRPWGARMVSTIVVSLAVPASAAITYALGMWPAPQALAVLLLILFLLAVKPLDWDSLGQFPPLLRPIVKHFARRG